jgi:hypothetical protein
MRPARHVLGEALRQRVLGQSRCGRRRPCGGRFCWKRTGALEG